MKEELKNEGLKGHNSGCPATQGAGAAPDPTRRLLGKQTDLP